jgi:hypothetical protein
MKTRSITMGIAIIWSVAALGAASLPRSGQMDGNKAAKDGVVIVTGCVAQAADGKHYMLNDAIMAPVPTDKMAASPAIAGTVGDKTVLSYMLDGGDMKSHVGHKVQITGTTTTQKMGKTDKSSDPAKMDTGTMAMDHKDVGGTLKIKSMKMVAASCM